MAETSSFFNSLNHDRKYKAEDWADYFSAFIGNGVFGSPSVGLQVLVSSGMNVTLKSGKAWINGYYYRNSADLTLTIPTADGVLKRIDRIVIKWDLTNRVIRAAVKSGTPSASPTAPALQRNADAYELAVADVLVNAGATTISQANITDQRQNNALCGLVVGLVNQINTTSLFAQFTATFDALMDTMEAQRTADAATFDAWFEDLQETLDENTAGNLLNRIDALKAESFTATLLSSGWTGSKPFTQEVNVTPVVEGDALAEEERPFIDVVLSNDAATAKRELKEWGRITKIDTEAGKVTATCLDKAPKCDLNIEIRVVK